MTCHWMGQQIMCVGQKGDFRESAEELSRKYAGLIRQQMRVQGVSLRTLVGEKVIKSHRRNTFNGKLDVGGLTIYEMQCVLFYLRIDPVQAAITFLCYDATSSYDDASCETVSMLTKSLAKHLKDEVESCDGEFATIRATLCETISRKTSKALLRHHAMVQSRHNGEDFDHVYG